jgi:hypothetical protein
MEINESLREYPAKAEIDPAIVTFHSVLIDGEGAVSEREQVEGK